MNYLLSGEKINQIQDKKSLTWSLFAFYTYIDPNDYTRPNNDNNNDNIDNKNNYT